MALLPTPPTGLATKALAASGIAKTGRGDCHLLLVTSSTSLVLNFYDGTDNTGTKFIDSLAVNASEEYDIPAHFETGLYVEFSSGSGKVTVFFV